MNIILAYNEAHKHDYLTIKFKVTRL